MFVSCKFTSHLKKNWQCSKCNTSFQQCEKTKQHREESEHRCQRSATHACKGSCFTLSSLSGYFLCGGLAAHCTEVSITWAGSGASTWSLLSTLKALIIPYHKTPRSMLSWLPLPTKDLSESQYFHFQMITPGLAVFCTLRTHVTSFSQWKSLFRFFFFLFAATILAWLQTSRPLQPCTLENRNLYHLSVNHV